MRRKIKSCAFLLALTLAFSGCVAVKVEEGQIPVKPEVTEAPEKQETPEVTQAPETPEITEQPEVTAEPEGSGVVEQPEATEEPVQDETGNTQEATLEIIRNAYESCKEIYDGIYPENIKALTICVATEEYISVNIAVGETLSPTDYYHMELTCENNQWNVTEFAGICAKNGPYAEELVSLEPLACDSVEFPEDTVVPLAMGSTVGVDLDGDGMQELIQVSFDCVSTMKKENTGPGSNPYRASLATIRVNDYIFDEDYIRTRLEHYSDNADMGTWYIFDLDVNDGYKEIGLYEEGPSDDPYTTLFRYHNGELRKIGGFSEAPSSGGVCNWSLKPEDDYWAMVAAADRSQIYIQVPGDGTVYATQRIDILETSFAEGMWKLQNSESFEEAKLELQMREEYTFLNHEYRRANTEYCPMVRDTLQVYAGKDMASDVIVLTQGEKIIPYRYYPDSEDGAQNGWIELVYGEDFKESVWIYVTNRMYIYQTDESGEVKNPWSGDMMDNLNFAD